MPLITLTDLADPRLAVFSRMTDAELRDPKQLVGLARAIDAAQASPGNPTLADSHGPSPTGTPASASASGPTPAGEADFAATGAPDPNRLADGLFIAESKNVIERALAVGVEPFALFVEDCWLNASRALIDHLLDDDPALPVFTASHDLMQQLTGYRTTRGPLAAFRRPPLPAVRDLLRGARRVAVLEDVTNYTNIGAIFRSAAALGIDAVLVTPACHDPYYRRAARVSMGTVFQVPWTRIEERTLAAGDAAATAATTSNNHALGSTPEPELALAAAPAPDSATATGDSPAPAPAPAAWPDAGIALLHAEGFKVAALALSDDSIPLQDARLKSCEKLALVLGTEGDGLAPRTIAACDFTVRIPMDHGVDSLNVAAASAVAFWELRVNHRA